MEAHEIGDAQAALWNGGAGRGWVEMQDVIEAMFKPFEDLLLEAVFTASADHVLDVGCGTGSIALAIARRLGETGCSVGIDISQPMIAAARARAKQDGARANFICANAEAYAFERASFDMIVSRFGVMFFADAVRAFANLRRAARDGARLRFVAWRSAAENPFMTTAERAAAPLLPNLPIRRSEAPGQFAFADQRSVAAVLEASGWDDVHSTPINVGCSFPASEIDRYIRWLGPVGVILQEADDRTRARVIEVVRAAYEPYVQGNEVRFTAACWIVRAGANPP